MIPFKHSIPDFKSEKYTKRYGEFIKAWKWHDKRGNWLFCTVRYETQDKKNIIAKGTIITETISRIIDTPSL